MVLIHFLVTVQKCVYPSVIDSINNQSERLVNGSFSNGEVVFTKTHAGNLHHTGERKKEKKKREKKRKNKRGENQYQILKMKKVPPPVVGVESSTL